MAITVETPKPLHKGPHWATIRTIMSQNGTAAWEKAPAGIKWNYCQMLSHYYANVKIDGCGNEQYRWVWLDVGHAVVFTGYGGDEYHGPTFNIHIQNTGW